MATSSTSFPFDVSTLDFETPEIKEHSHVWIIPFDSDVRFGLVAETASAFR